MVQFFFNKLINISIRGLYRKPKIATSQLFHLIKEENTSQVKVSASLHRVLDNAQKTGDILNKQIDCINLVSKLTPQYLAKT